jgi:hypothetical protein
MGLFGSIGKILGKVAPVAALIPGVGTLAGGAAALAGKALGGGGAAPAAGGGGGSSIWDTLGKIGGVVGGGVKAYNDSKNAGLDRRSQEASDALAQKRFGLDESRFGEDKRQFDDSMGFKTKQLGEDTRQFDQKFGLDTEKFGKEKETEQFKRAQNTRYAKVRAPLIGGLMRGQQLKNIPGVPGGM